MAFNLGGVVLQGWLKVRGRGGSPCIELERSVWGFHARRARKSCKWFSPRASSAWTV